MSLHELLKNLFGFPDRSSYGDEFTDPNNQQPFCDDCGGFHDDDNEPEGNWSFSFGNIDDMFRHFHGEMRQQMDEMQQQMEDMSEHFGVMEFPGIEVGPNDGEERRDSPSVRDHMLKVPEGDRSKNFSDRFGFNLFGKFGGMFDRPIGTQQKHDKELDDVKTDDIVKLYEKPDADSGHYLTPQEPLSPHSHFTKVSVRVTRKADGTVEEERTVCNSDGKCETTVTRSTNDLDPHNLMIRDSQGIMDRIKRHWSAKRDDPVPRREIQGVPDDTIFERIFGKKRP